VKCVDNLKNILPLNLKWNDFSIVYNLKKQKSSNSWTTYGTYKSVGYYFQKTEEETVVQWTEMNNMERGTSLHKKKIQF